MERDAVPVDQKAHHYKEANSPKLIYKFNAVPTEIFSFVNPKKLIIKFMRKNK